MPTNAPTPRHALPAAFPPGQALSDLTGGLVWPRLLQAPALAGSFGSLLVATAACALIGLIDAAPRYLPGVPADSDGIFGETIRAMGFECFRLGGALVRFDAAVAFESATDLIYRIPASAFAGRPVTATLVFGLSLIIAILASAIVSRRAALAFGGHRPASIAELLRDAMKRLVSLAAAAVLPAVLLASSLLLLWALAWVTLGIPYLQALTAVAFGLAVPVSLIAVFLGLVTVVGTPLMLPCVMTEGSDALDAIQRVLAYVRAAPARLVAYILIAGSACLLAAFVAVAAADWSIRLIDTVGLAIVGETSGKMIRTAETGFGPWTGRTAMSIFRFWEGVPVILAAGYLLSLFNTASTLIYLGMRRVVDGQDMGEVWIPGTALARDAASAESPDEEEA